LITFELNLGFPIEKTIEKYYSLLDVIPIFGGYFTILTSLFITGPILLFSTHGFIRKMT